VAEVNLEAPEIQAAIKAEAAKLVEAETGGLKTKNNELLDEVKSLKKKLEGFDPDEFKRLKDAEREAGDRGIKDPVEFRKRIEEEFAPRLAKAEQDRDEALRKLNDTIVDNQLTASLVEAGVAKEFLRAVKADVSSTRKIDVIDGGVVIDGKPVGDFVKAWSAEDGKSFIAAANNSGGGGRGGNGGGAAGANKVSDMSNADKAAFIREHGAQAWADKVANEMKVK
jgi:hypothetical protein